MNISGLLEDTLLIIYMERKTKILATKRAHRTSSEKCRKFLTVDLEMVCTGIETHFFKH